jgi:hypothetical protein
MPGVERKGTAIASAPSTSPLQPCRGPRPEDAGKAVQMTDCYAAPAQGRAGELPLTAGRELVAKSEWNVWADTGGSRLRDQRDGMDTKGNSKFLSVGLDRVVNDDLVAGFQFSFSRSASDSFGGDMTADSSSVTVGPYVSYSVSPHWLAYASLGLGRQRTDTQLVGLSGTANANLYSLNLQAEGQYALGSAFARPKVQLSHTHNAGSSYQLQGSVLGTPVSVDMNNPSSEFGIVQGSLEINRTFDLGNRRLLMPYIELGVNYAYARPQSGKRLTGDLTYVDSSPWGGILRAGLRSSFGKSTLATFELANKSIGISNLSIWELSLLVSHSF